MFCPECGTQNPDNAKFCISCGFQTRQASGAAGSPPPQQFIASAPASSKTNYGLAIVGVLALIVIGGLVSFILFRGSIASNQEPLPTPRVKTASNASNAAAGNTQPAGNTASSSNAVAAAPGSTPAVVTASPTAQPTTKAVKKPVDCDRKCYQVYDQCMADYRQHPDPETICRGRQTTCLAKCS